MFISVESLQINFGPKEQLIQQHRKVSRKTHDIDLSVSSLNGPESMFCEYNFLIVRNRKFDFLSSLIFWHFSPIRNATRGSNVEFSFVIHSFSFRKSPYKKWRDWYTLKVSKIVWNCVLQVQFVVKFKFDVQIHW